ncbi:MAG TPA: dTDP-4-dehydrorhamnose reductase [Terriglobales bacterium]|nr:dTDP-4-dehydrorhamnose reductase [Terriglobales bacterium]
MKIVITGAKGLLGTHFCRLLSARHEVIGCGHDHVDVCDRSAVDAALRQWRPAAVINCATVLVDQCEQQPALARAINVEAPALLAEACGRVGAQLVHFSTNYVFGGQQQERPYRVDDIAQPLNEYGRSKLAGERAVRERLAESHVVRTSWIYGPLRRNFLGSIPQQLREGRRLKAIADSFANTTYAPELVGAVEQLLRQRNYGLHQIVSQGTLSRYQFAIEAAALVGLSRAEAEDLIEISTEAEAGQEAPRPRWSPMACSTTASLPLIPLRPWQDALREHISCSLAVAVA